MQFNLINVGIADLGVSKAPDVLRTILGSCVGICLYDGEARIGGLSHIMLPVHRGISSTESVKKYADTAIPALIDEICGRGGVSGRLTAKIIGGAKMFNVGDKSIIGEIGNNNITKVREILGSLKIAIVAEDTGGTFGRTIDFHLASGEVHIRSMGRNERVI